MDSAKIGRMVSGVLRDFGFRVWGTPPGQTGGVYRIWAW
jgi:hypothetical protein